MVISSLWENVFKVPILLTNFKYSMFLNYSLIEFLLLDLNYSNCQHYVIHLLLIPAKCENPVTVSRVRDLGPSREFRWLKNSRPSSPEDLRVLQQWVTQDSGETLSPSHNIYSLHPNPTQVYSSFIYFVRRKLYLIFTTAENQVAGYCMAPSEPTIAKEEFRTLITALFQQHKTSLNGFKSIIEN